MWKKIFLLPVLFVMCFSLCSAQLAYAFNFALESSNSDLSKAKIPEPSQEFIDGVDAIVMSGKAEGTYWYDVRPPAEAVALFKKGMEEKNCPYCRAAYGYNIAAWNGKIDQGIELLIQSDTENCVYGSMFLSMIFWYARTLDIYSITAAEATQYIVACLDRLIALQKYLDRDQNGWVNDEVVSHILMFGYNFAGEAGFVNFIPPNATLAAKYLKAARGIYQVAYPDNSYGNEELNNYIENLPDYILNSTDILCQRYGENVVGADKIFKNKTVRMSGSVMEIGKSRVLGNKISFSKKICIVFIPSVSLENDVPIVVAAFNDSEEDKIANLRKNEKITFQGKVSGLQEGADLSAVWVTDCVIVGGDAEEEY